MRHISIKLNTPCEFIDIVPLNPLISKCQIKVCYVGEQPNRNGSVITEEVAREMARSLPGSPIVGRYLEDKKDFEEHSREMSIKNGELVFEDVTQPYGFVDLGAKVWFQDFSDDGVTHKYLMTEGYIWTGRYPEAQRIIDKGNNQSMELDQKSLNGNWSTNLNEGYEFFIINEAVISALCILGEDVEPCFEGASIEKVQFALEDNFKNELFSMMNEIKEFLSKGGKPVEDNEKIIDEVTSVEETEVVTDFAEEVKEEETTEVVEAEATEEVVAEEAPAAEEVVETEFAEAEEAKEVAAEAPAEEEAPEATYNLEEIPEFIELTKSFAAAQAQIESLTAELESLREFKCSIERTEKQELIEKFYMLSDEDKKDVVDNIDSYSLSEIEAKLCVACYRSGVGFGSTETEAKKDEVTTFNLGSVEDTTPAWIKAVEQHKHII
jgi:hypothetical protein